MVYLVAVDDSRTCDLVLFDLEFSKLVGYFADELKDHILVYAITGMSLVYAICTLFVLYTVLRLQ